MGEKIICPHCQRETVKDNFCTVCGQKIVDVCDCWVLHRPYDCRQDKCPGMHLLVIEAKGSVSLLPKQ